MRDKDATNGASSSIRLIASFASFALQSQGALAPSLVRSPKLATMTEPLSLEIWVEPPADVLASTSKRGTERSGTRTSEGGIEWNWGEHGQIGGMELSSLDRYFSELFRGPDRPSRTSTSYVISSALVPRRFSVRLEILKAGLCHVHLFRLILPVLRLFATHKLTKEGTKKNGLKEMKNNGHLTSKRRSTGQPCDAQETEVGLMDRSEHNKNHLTGVVDRPKTCDFRPAHYKHRQAASYCY